MHTPFTRGVSHCGYRRKRQRGPQPGGGGNGCPPPGGTSAAHQMMRLTCRARVGQQHTAAAHSSSTQQHSSSTQQHTATAHSSSTQQNTAAHSRTHTVSRLTTMVTQCVYKNGANLQCSILLQLHVCSGNNINIKGKHSWTAKHFTATEVNFFTHSRTPKFCAHNVNNTIPVV